jgi:hypothetical protein
MSEPEPDAAAETLRALQAHADNLERQLRETEIQSALRLRQAELKAEALRAGIVDLDGLRLLDDALVHSDSAAAAVVSQLRQDKPWLFAAATTSSSAVPPSPMQPQRKLATDMSVEEWRTARAELLRRR